MALRCARVNCCRLTPQRFPRAAVALSGARRVTSNYRRAFSGFNRGNIKNVVKLAFNPKKADRDAIFPVGINPVVTFPVMEL
jgi:hypothetical protein